MALYEEDGVEQPQKSLYTAEDTVPVPDTNVGNYSVLKGIAAFATGNADIPDKINFDQFVDSNWRTTVPEQNEIDRSLAAKAASEGNVNIVQQTLDSVAARNKLYGEISTNNANEVRAKLKELTDQAVEQTAVRNPAVLFNNTPDEINASTARVSSRLQASATLDKAITDGSSWSTIATGLGFEFLPIAAEQGAEIDRVSVKYGVPSDAISRTTPRSQTKSYLQAAFNGQPEEAKGEWLSGLYNDLKASWLISDWQAAIIVQEVATNEDQNWGGLSDWLDRLGVVGVALGGAGAVIKSTRLAKGATAIKNVERTLAASGGKGAIVSAEGAKIASQVANKMRLQAVGVVAGELTGVNTAIDLAKLVSMNANKVLPDVITTAANDLQRSIRAPVEKLINELQDVIAAKGVRSSEAAAELTELQRIYSKANNPNIHSVDPFSLSEDGLVISGKVFYKPDTSSSFLTQGAAEAYIKAADPTGSIGMKAVPDTTNTGFLVEQNIKTDLQLRKTALEAQILEEINTVKPKRGKKAVAETPPIERAPAPKTLTDSKPRYKTSTLSFADDIDKAAYQIGSKTATSKSDKEIKTWLQNTTGWDDATIAGHAQKVRDYVKANENAVDEVGNIVVGSQVPIGRPPSLSQISYTQTFANLQAAPGTTTIGNITMSDGVKKAFVIEFVNKLGKSLGMENRRLVVMDYEDMIKSKDPSVQSYVANMKQKHTSAGAVHYDIGDGQSFIVMRRGPSTKPLSLRQYMENFAHEYGHAFEAEFATKYFGIINSSFNKWLRAKGIKFKGDGINKSVLDVFPPEALLEYRSITNAEDIAVNWIDKWAGGDVSKYQLYETQIHKWASSYSEFFAENFAKWAFTDEVATTVLGQAFKKLVDGFKLIVAEVQARLGMELAGGVGAVDKNIAAMLNTHIKGLQDQTAQVNANMTMIASESKKVKPSLASLQKELDSVSDELNAIDDAEKGLKTGWLVEQPINRTLDYSIVGKYSDADINSAARFAMGDWALSTSSELYSQRLVGINQGSRYQKLLTTFVRPSIEKLSKAEMVALNDALVIGDKEGKLFSEHELAGQGLSSNAREAYFKVRALRDVMWQMRNDVAAKSMTRKGYVQLNTGIKFDDSGNQLFAKPTTPKDGSFVYLSDTGTMQRMGTEFREEAATQGYIFYEAAEPMLIDGKYRKTFAFKDGGFASQKIDTVIPYRAGEYRRIYSDEYFVKIKSSYEVDGSIEEVVTTHRTAANVADANAYVKALTEAQDLHAAGKLSIQEASRLMEPFGWRPEEIIEALDSGRFGTNFKAEVKYNRTDDDYVSEAIGLSSNFSSKRGDKVLSVFGKDTVNTVSPLDSVAAEIGNTAYVASTTEWRESHIQRWFNTFADELPANVREMTPDNAFRYMLNNKGMYVGQSKRLQVAEKVQDYIIAQMNIPTKEEKEYLGFMRMLSESIEGKGGGGKPVMKLGAALRATKDYPTWARTVAFHSFFAFNPVQFFMQGMNAFNAVAISPVHGIASAKSSALYAMALFSDQESIWQTVAKTNKLTNLGLGMSEEEFVEVVRAIRRTGLMDGINTSSLYGAEVGKYGIMNKLTRRVGDVAATPFNSGEGYSRLVSFDIARREYIATNPGSAWWTDDALGTILKRQDDLTQNMTRANTASWQQGWKSIPAQFIQYQVKLMMNVVQSLLGNTRAFSQKEALQLLVTHAVVMGTAGNFLWPFRDLLTDVVPENMSEEARLYVQQGVVAGMIGSITDGEAKLALGSRFNTFKYYEDIVKGMLDPEKTFMEVAGGPSGFAALRILGGFGEAFSIIAKAPMTMDTLQIALGEIGKSSFSFFNNIEKARIAMNNYNQVQSGAGGAMFRVTDTEAWMIGMGIPAAAQEDLSIMYTSSKKHSDEIKEASKAVGKHAMLALTALRKNDKEGHRTHAAVVQAILNNYTGSDLQQLYKAAYKVEAFTQYEKMLTDQAMKDWAVKDLMVNTGVNE